MSYLDIIKDGIRTVNKHWQLVFVQLLSAALVFVSFFLIVGTPIAIAFILFGLDLTEILRMKDIISALQGSAGLLHKYFGMALIIILSLLLYIILFLIILVFTMAGTVGALAASIREGIEQFSSSVFWRRGKALFFPLFIFLFSVAVIFIVPVLVLWILGDGASAIVDAAKGHDATLGLFLGVFFSLVLFSVGFLLFLAILSIMAYGIAYLVFNRPRPFKAVSEAARYLYATPSAFLFNVLLLMIYLIMGFLVIMISYPLTLVPVVGPLISLPFQLVSYAIQAYVNLVMLAAVLHYFFKTGPVQPVLQSTGPADIFPPEAPEQPQAPEPSEETQQG